MVVVVMWHRETPLGAIRRLKIAGSNFCIRLSQWSQDGGGRSGFEHLIKCLLSLFVVEDGVCCLYLVAGVLLQQQFPLFGSNYFLVVSLVAVDGSEESQYLVNRLLMLGMSAPRVHLFLP